MKGAIIGDIIGSAFINDSRSTTDFQLFKPISSFTADTVLTISTADAVCNKKSFEASLKEWVKKYPYAGYNEDLKRWAMTNENVTFTNSGDGSARRISPIGLVAQSMEELYELTEATTRVTHNNFDKINASKATSVAIYMAKNGANKSDIKDFITCEFGYNLDNSMEELRKEVSNPNLETPVPAAISVFLKSNNYEDAIRKAIAIGGPSNTIGSITGAIAHAYFKHIPKSIIRRALNRLTPEMVRFINKFEEYHLRKQEESNEVLLAVH